MYQNCQNSGSGKWSAADGPYWAVSTNGGSGDSAVEMIAHCSFFKPLFQKYGFTAVIMKCDSSHFFLVVSYNRLIRIHEHISIISINQFSIKFSKFIINLNKLNV